MMKQRKQINRILILVVMLLVTISFNNLHSQIKEIIYTDDDYILSKFSYSKTKKIAKIYCNMYPDKFNCRDIESSDREMFPEEFNLADIFFIKLIFRPIGRENYNALNIAGLYLRNKRPGKNDTTFEYSFLDIELEFLTDRAYSHNDELTAMHDDEIQFKLSFLSLLEENLFLLNEKIYASELAACNNFEGPYYEASRRFFTDVLSRLLELEKNQVILEEIEIIFTKIPDKYKI